jgi:hypothetical protein
MIFQDTLALIQISDTVGGEVGDVEFEHVAAGFQVGPCAGGRAGSTPCRAERR